MMNYLFLTREDYKLAENFRTEEEKQELYVELKSGAESGWDYSTRWFVNNNTNKGEFRSILAFSNPSDLSRHSASLDPAMTSAVSLQHKELSVHDEPQLEPSYVLVVWSCCMWDLVLHGIGVESQDLSHLGSWGSFVLSVEGTCCMLNLCVDFVDVSNIQHWNDLTSDVVVKGYNFIPLRLKSIHIFYSVLIS